MKEKSISSTNNTNIMSNRVELIKTVKCFSPIIKKFKSNRAFGMTQFSGTTTYFCGTESYSQLTSTNYFLQDSNADIVFITNQKYIIHFLHYPVCYIKQVYQKKQ